MNEQIETLLRTLNLLYPNFTVCVITNERGTGNVSMASNLPSQELTESFIKDIGGQLQISSIKKLN